MILNSHRLREIENDKSYHTIKKDFSEENFKNFNQGEINKKRESYNVKIQNENE